MAKLWMDTNFLMARTQFGVDIFGELDRLMDSLAANNEKCVPIGVVNELKSLSNGNGKDAIAAKVGLKLIEEKKLSVFPSEGKVDDFLVSRAEEGDIVCTNDLELIRRLREKKIRRIQIRGRTHLDFAR